jgi:subtilisin family serine protease
VVGRRRLWRGGAVVALTAALAASVVASVAPGAVAQPETAAGRGEPVSVTLVSGDRVELWGTGPSAPLRVEPAPRGHSVPFEDYWHHGDRYVVPGDAALLVGSGLLDRELFNVTGLIRQGYDDAHTAAVPLLVEYADAGARARAAVPAGATVRRALPELNLTALDQNKDSVTSFYDGLTAPTARGAGGVRKVWLNKRVRATLDQSVPQIGAPAAWQRGLTGAGVRVAVLDTGIDTDHPDLAGKVAVGEDFTGTGGIEDGFGHGTHVASIITGTGAASGGKYRGVAPDVTLAVGKVLDDSGYGTDDSVLAGMRWAAAESGAKVVNMSLGADPSDGQDPMSLAVNTLSRQYGTLFVIAAGNFGVDRSVASPGAADDALTVGSVSKQDKPSDFSSRGPRLGDGAAKPEISAPGGGIVAAAPAGVPPLGEPVGDSYQKLDGTSMATPHVAGAAAILAQQHPDWTAPTLKSALVSSAHEISDAGVYQVGAGRLDVDRATATPVVATAAVSAYLPWPNTGSQERRTVAWTNNSDAPVTLALKADLVDGKGQPAPAGLVTLASDGVTVPAGGSVPVELVVTGQEGHTGTYSGVLVASGAGGVQTRTAISVYQQEQRFSFTPKLLDRNGVEPVDEFQSSAFVVDLNSGDTYNAASGMTITLPRGRYAVHAAIMTAAPGQESSYTTISHPELNLDRDVTQVFDARIGQPVTAEPDNPDARGGTHAMYVMSKVQECDCLYAFYTDVDARFEPLYAATLPGTASDAYALGVARRATTPNLEMVANDGQPFDVNLQSLFGAPPTEETSLTAVYGGSGTPEDLAKIDATGKLVVVEFDPYVGREEWLRRGVDIAKAGGKLAMFRFVDEGATPLPPGDPIEGEPVPTFYGSDNGTVDRLTELVKKGETTVDYASREATEHRYELLYGVQRQVTSPVVYRPRTRDLATMRAAYHDNAPNTAGFVAFGKLFGRYVGTGWFARTAGGQERVEYFTPTEWDLEATTGPYILTDTATLAAHRPPTRVVWNKAVVGPSLRGTTKNFVPEVPHPWSWRNGGKINIKVPMYGDAAGRPRMVETFVGNATGSVTVYRDGVALGTGPVDDFSEYPVPDQDSSYRVVADARQSDPTWPLSTVVTAEWSFHSSSAGEGKALPMLTTRFDPAVDVHNRAPGNRRFSFPAYVERQDGPARITSLSVDVSYDDGVTWQRADVRRDHDHWTVSVRQPRNGYVSLRSRAADADGNRLDQTIIRAYQLG